VNDKLLMAIGAAIVLAGIESDDEIAWLAPFSARSKTVEEVGALATEALLQCALAMEHALATEPLF